ncbi:MAG: iron-sulfur cluster insertion protein ErpA [Polyangia bacterium]|jgi:iron-sulfur cluster insertion protein
MSVITTNIRKPDAAAEQVPVVPVAATSPILLTEVAAKKVQEIRDQESIEESMFLRVRIVGGGCSGFSYDLYFDTSTPMDKQLQSNGVTVIVDQMSLQYLRGTEIDYVEGLQGAGFKFHNPNVKSTCGCGSSFSV